MKNLFLLAAFFPLTLAFASDNHSKSHTAPSAKPHTAHWSYGGAEGPDNWGKIAPEYEMCEHGKRQSPIDLKWSKQKGSRSLEFHYSDASYTVVDNGHTIQVNVPAGSYAMIDGKRYDLAQFHFHTLSEHTFSGKHFPLEAHFVHKDSNGALAVVGVMFNEGKSNPDLAKIFKNIPKTKDSEVKVSSTFNPSSLIPASHTHYKYDGSLTTPPCSENVNWTVLNSPKEMSEDQIRFFNQHYVNNNRPTQPLHERTPASF